MINQIIIMGTLILLQLYSICNLVVVLTIHRSNKSTIKNDALLQYWKSDLYIQFFAAGIGYRNRDCKPLFCEDSGTKIVFCTLVLFFTHFIAVYGNVSLIVANYVNGNFLLCCAYFVLLILHLVGIFLSYKKSLNIFSYIG